MRIHIFSFCLLALLSCKKEKTESVLVGKIIGDAFTENYKINTEGKTILERFPAVEGYKTVTGTEGSFAKYLQDLALKKYGDKVKYFNGAEKKSKGIYVSVVDMDISKRDLQQCADAVMRLKAEYHYHKKEFDRIHFNFLSDGKPRYFKDYVKGDYSYATFLRYMDYVMAFANTASLKDELNPVSIKDIQIGDVLIQKGNPFGHAVIVVNLAKNTNGNKQGSRLEDLLIYCKYTDNNDVLLEC